MSLYLLGVKGSLNALTAVNITPDNSIAIGLNSVQYEHQLLQASHGTKSRLLTFLCIVVLAYFVASASPNMDVANATLPTYVVTLLFFAGFLFRITDIPNYWFWYSRIDFLRYSWGALMRNQFVGEDNAVLTGDGKHHSKH